MDGTTDGAHRQDGVLRKGLLRLDEVHERPRQAQKSCLDDEIRASRSSTTSSPPHGITLKAIKLGLLRVRTARSQLLPLHHHGSSTNAHLPSRSTSETYRISTHFSTHLKALVGCSRLVAKDSSEPILVATAETCRRSRSAHSHDPPCFERP